MVLLAVGLVAAGAGPAAAAKRAPETVTVVGNFGVGDPETDALEAEFAAFANENRVEITYEQVSPEDLEGRLAGPNPPDLIISPLPTELEGLAPYLVDLGGFVNPRSLRRDFGNGLIDLATVDGAVFGAPIKADLKSLVWYKPAVFDAYGYSVPGTFAELVALSDRMVADGFTPWCNYIESGPATGWMGTDWVEDLLLGAEGPAVYDPWVDHTVLFSDARVEKAFERYQQMIDTAGYVFERADMLTTTFFSNAPALEAGSCLMHKQGSFFGQILGAFGLDTGEYSTFKFPSVNAAYSDAAMGGSTYVAASNERNVVRQLTRFMLSQRFGRAALADIGWILPNVRFDNSRYPDGLTHSWADIVQAAVGADQFRFDASDLMPQSGATFWAGIVDLVGGTKTIPQVLTYIDASWPT